MNNTALLIDGLYNRLARAFDRPQCDRQFLIYQLTDYLSQELWNGL